VPRAWEKKRPEAVPAPGQRPTNRRDCFSTIIYVSSAAGC